MRKPPGNWIFVSHSNDDVDAVRKIRDYLEQQGHSPILFFMLCLSNDDQLPSLIEREINARSFFVLCDSDSARKSVWVQQEIEMVKRAHAHKVYEEINLESDFSKQLPQLKALIKRATVYLSYSNKDRMIASVIAPALAAADFKVIVDAEPVFTLSIAQVMERSIDEAARDGFVLVLLSRDHLASYYAQKELAIAIEKAAKYGRSNVVPIIIEDGVQVPPGLGLERLHPFRMLPIELNERLPELIRQLKMREMA